MEYNYIYEATGKKILACKFCCAQILCGISDSQKKKGHVTG